PSPATPPTPARAARRSRPRPRAAPRRPARSADSPARRCRTGGPSGQDLVHEPVGALALGHPLLVVARDHLADQAEREELEADDDEEHAQREQRPPADRVAAELQDRQVDEDPEPDRAEREPEPAEEVERPVPVAADERDGQEVEEAAQ